MSKGPDEAKEIPITLDEDFDNSWNWLYFGHS